MAHPLYRKSGLLLLLLMLLAACGSTQSAESAATAVTGEPVLISVSGAFARFPIVSLCTEQ